MRDEFPDDVDGETLRRVVDAGADLLRPMVINFSVAAPDEAAARAIATIVAAVGFDPSLGEDEKSKAWSVYCSKSMLATYDGVVAEQIVLAALVAPHGGAYEGWGTFGN